MEMLTVAYFLGLAIVLVLATAHLALKWEYVRPHTPKSSATIMAVLPTALGYAVGWPLALLIVGFLRLVRYIIDIMDRPFQHDEA